MDLGRNESLDFYRSLAKGLPYTGGQGVGQKHPHLAFQAAGSGSHALEQTAYRRVFYP